MRRFVRVELVLAGCLMAAPGTFAQAPAGNGAGQSKPAGAAQKPVAKPPTDANPFPEDTSTVPVMPAKETPDLQPGAFDGSEDNRISLPGDDQDPVRSPDDTANSSQDADSSSSVSVLDSLAPMPDATKKGRRGAVEEPAHVETAAEDISVGKYYLDSKNWRAALSRFQSALVLAPEDPEVYWGLAESARRLGNFADARGYYLKVIEYDPDSRHAKDAARVLKEPEMANAKAAAAGQAK